MEPDSDLGTQVLGPPRSAPVEPPAAPVEQPQPVREGPSKAFVDELMARPEQPTAKLTAEQRVLHDRVVAIARSRTAIERRQPGFDRARSKDPGYREQYILALDKHWQANQNALDAIAREVAARAGGTPGWRTRRKNMVRAMAKVDDVYGGDASRLTDLAAAKVQFTVAADMYRGLAALLEVSAGRARVVEFADRFVRPQRGGYRDLRVLLELTRSDGTKHIAEFGLHLAAMDRAAEELAELRRAATAREPVEEERGAVRNALDPEA
ncbi:hypothetical protein [Actinokineospora enzanensis]|uniref:hypothetical protein n=1 Tax=Actinokineospora enzanensis TaxID=155975 RepID=UPI00035C95FD|nr:hypothetical protein [Actinokineospora enzanensis]